MHSGMKVTKVVGLCLFVSGFVIFNTLFFNAKYRLTESAIQNSINDSSKATLFIESSTFLLNEERPSAFVFVSELKKIFETANEIQLGVYGITQEEVLDLVSRSEKKFSIASVDSLYLGNDEVS